jgi:hypothetical protein
VVGATTKVYTPPPDTEAERTDRLGPTWPYGLAADLALGAGFTVAEIRRLRAPATRLP